MKVNVSSSSSSGLRRLAIVTACAVFPLIFVGAGVTTKEVGMAFPDGFTANGHFWTNPPGWWQAMDTRWEHGHRLLGRTVGVLAILVAVWAWRAGGAVRWLALVSLGAICTQGVLGALRVNEVSTALAMVHGIFGQLCFCLTCAVALTATQSWADPTRVSVREAGFLKRLCLGTTAILFLQLVLGAAVRHYPSDAALLAHVFWAMVVTFVLGWLAAWTAGLKSAAPLTGTFGAMVGVLMIVQLLLGGGAFVVTMMGGVEKTSILFAVPTAHVAVGALLLAATLLLTMLCFRTLRTAEKAQTIPQGATASIA